MKKKIKIEVDCPNCAAKLEAAVQKVDGVNAASYAFMSQKLLIEANDDRMDAVLADVLKTCKKAVPDCIIHE